MSHSILLIILYSSCCLFHLILKWMSIRNLRLKSNNRAAHRADTEQRLDLTQILIRHWQRSTVANTPKPYTPLKLLSDWINKRADWHCLVLSYGDKVCVCGQDRQKCQTKTYQILFTTDSRRQLCANMWEITMICRHYIYVVLFSLVLFWFSGGFVLSYFLFFISFQIFIK